MKFFTTRTNKKSHILKNLTRVSGILCTLVMGLVFNTEFAHASIASYVNSLFGGEQVSAKSTSYVPVTNSQTMALLQAPVNSDPDIRKAYYDSPIVGNVLVADIALSELETDPINTHISSYIVREGDTLSGIAGLFGVSVNTILWVNDIQRNVPLRVGQSILILPVSGITHKVQSGDTLRSIASQYKADFDDIVRRNDLTPASRLVVGQTIIVPDAEISTPTPVEIAHTNNPAHDTGGKLYPGYYTRPVIGGTRTQGLHGYNGIDIAGPAGMPIYAAADGIVLESISTGWNGGYGSMVIISHDNGTQTVYAHCSKTLVAVGQKVYQGEQIALMGSTGKATGSHIHFEIRGAKNPF
jgi:LysM repeat protein